MVFDPENEAAVQRGVETGRIMAEAASLARDLANQPAKRDDADRLALHAEEVATQHGWSSVCWSARTARSWGWAPSSAWRRAAWSRPSSSSAATTATRMTPTTTWNHRQEHHFDSGGISSRERGHGPDEGDMSGGASVIGAMHAIGQLKPRINVTMIAAATENMPSGSATRPGDILKSMSGKTIEVDKRTPRAG